MQVHTSAEQPIYSSLVDLEKTVPVALSLSNSQLQNYKHKRMQTLKKLNAIA